MRFAVFALTLLAAPPALNAQEMLPELSPVEVVELARDTYRGGACWWDRVEAELNEVRSWNFTFRYEYEKDDDGPARPARLYQVPCHYGAYNVQSLFFYETEFDGLGPLHFAEPELEIDYADDSDTVVRSIKVVGFASTSALVNASYDEGSRTITSFSRWRGLGDASSSGTWMFRDGHFVLTEYSVDASYDGEITPETVYSARGD